MGSEALASDCTAALDIRGYLDAFRGGVWTGWVASVSRPGKSLPVQIWLDGEVVADGLADTYRLDLQRLGIGNGYHGFEISLAPRFAYADVDDFELREAVSGTKLEKAQHFSSDPSAHSKSILFDPAYYEMQGGPAREGLEHYKTEGWRLGLDPHPLFQTEFYLASHGDDVFDDPLTHFHAVGILTRAQTHPLFDVDFYDRVYAGPSVHPLMRYLADAKRDGSSPSAFFSEGAYQNERSADVGDIEPGLTHYVTKGFREGRRPNPEFDPALFGTLAGFKSNQEPFSRFVADLLRLEHATISRSADPAASIIILNHCKAITTLQCLYFIRKHTALEAVEIIVVDNGSHPEDFLLLSRYAGEARILRLSTNRGFGEANNIAAESAQGEVLVFLNNDVFVKEGWLPPLLSAFDDPSIGAAGPKFLQPNGLLQEAGASISLCGTALQRGRDLNPCDALFNRTEVVDYCSAATLAVRTSAFTAVLGYDLRWDPAYFEDADLCLRLKQRGFDTIYVPRSEVIHLEHVTSGDAFLDLGLHNVMAINRAKFVERWGDTLANGLGPETSRPLENASGQTRVLTKRAAFFTPYPLHAGGGERYLLSMAAVLQDRFRCSLVTQERFSASRLKTLARDLRVELDDMDMLGWDEAVRQGPYDLFTCMNNEVLPAAPPIGRKNLFHCQFPFPIAPNEFARRWGYLEGYEGLIVNSQFTARNMRREAARHALRLPATDILYPPVLEPDGSELSSDRAPPHIILNVGRFDPNGHCKNQEVMIAEFRRLLHAVNFPLELHLVGGIGDHAGARHVYLKLLDDARNLPVFFHPNATAERLEGLYRRASLYWHLTGAGQDVTLRPEVFEHFGISIVEAMGYGAVPIAIRFGGPSEIIGDSLNGALISGADELSARSARLLTGDDLPMMRKAAQERSRDFAASKFASRLNNIVSFIMSESEGD